MKQESHSGRLPATMERYGVGRNSVERIARESGGVVRVGRATLYLWDKMDSYLSAQADAQARDQTHSTDDGAQT